MQTSSVVKALSDFDLVELREGLSSWPDATKELLDEAIEYVSDIQRRFITLAETVDSEEELPNTLAINYIELKSHWIALNTKINYSMFKTGSCDSLDPLKATAVSQLLAAIEEFLSPDEIGTITDFLAEPVKRAA